MLSTDECSKPRGRRPDAHRRQELHGPTGALPRSRQVGGRGGGGQASGDTGDEQLVVSPPLVAPAVASAPRRAGRAGFRVHGRRSSRRGRDPALLGEWRGRWRDRPQTSIAVTPSTPPTLSLAAPRARSEMGAHQVRWTVEPASSSAGRGGSSRAAGHRDQVPATAPDAASAARTSRRAGELSTSPPGPQVSPPRRVSWAAASSRIAAYSSCTSAARHPRTASATRASGGGRHGGDVGQVHRQGFQPSRPAPRTAPEVESRAEIGGRDQRRPRGGLQHGGVVSDPHADARSGRRGAPERRDQLALREPGHARVQLGVAAHERKLRKIVLPPSVRIDSGWNWTPSTRKTRCRRPMISPSSARADTSRSAGTVPR